MLKQELSHRSVLKQEIIIEVLNLGLDLQKAGVVAVADDVDIIIYEDMAGFSDFVEHKAHNIELSDASRNYLRKMSTSVDDLYSEIKHDMAKYKKTPAFTKSNVLLALNRIDKDILYRDRPTHASESQWYVVQAKTVMTNELSHKEHMRRELTDYYEQSQ